ncbi:MAG: hypothetical protein QM496_05455 [Verrucomicrobiota bacterium]
MISNHKKTILHNKLSLRVPSSAFILGTGFALVLNAINLSPSSAEPLKIAKISADRKVDFGKEIYPFLRKNCLACHNTTKAKAKLNIETPELMIKGGDTGASVVPGKGNDSLLFTTSGHIEEPTMPPDKNKSKAKNLTPEQLALLKLWIDQGAIGSRVIAEAPKKWAPLTGIQPIYASALSSDGHFAAVGRGHEIQLYDLRRGKLISTISDPALKDSGLSTRGAAHKDFVSTLAFSPNGDLASGGFRIAKLWTMTPSKKESEVALPAESKTVTTSPDGKWIASGGIDGSITLVNAHDAKAKPVTVKDHGAAVTALAFTSDNASLISASADKSLRLRSVAAPTKSKKIDTGIAQNALVYLKTGNQLACAGSDNQIRLYPLSAFDPPAAPAAKPAPKPAVKKPAPAKATPAPKPAAKKSAAAPSASHSPALARARALTAIITMTEVTAVSAPAKKVAPAKPAAKPAPPKPATAKKPAPAKAAAPKPAAKPPAPKKPAALVYTELKGHSKPVSSLALLDPEGKQIVSASEDGSIRIWDIAGKKAIRTINHGGGAVAYLAVSANGQYILSSAKEGPARLWNAKDGKRLAELKGNADLLAERDAMQRRVDLAKRLAAEFTKALPAAEKVWQEESTKATEAATKAVAARLETEKKITMLKRLRRKLPAAKEADLKKATEETAKAKNALAIAERNRDLSIRLTSQAAEKHVALKIKNQTATTIEKSLSEEIKKLNEGIKKDDAIAVQALAFSNDSSQAAVALADGSLRFWNASTGKFLHSIEQSSPTLAIHYAATGQLLGAQKDKKLATWNPDPQWTWTANLGDGENSDIFPDRVTALAYSRDGSILATGSGVPSRSGELRLWDALTHKTIIANNEAHDDTIAAIAFSPDDRKIATASTDRFVKTFDPGTLEFIRGYEGHTSHVLAVDWSPDGRFLASGSADKQVKIWDFETGSQTKKIEGYEKEVTAVAYISNTDQLLTASGDKKVKLGTVALPDTDSFIYTAAISAGGAYVIAGGQDGKLRVWDGKTRKILYDFPSLNQAEEKNKTAQVK